MQENIVIRGVRQNNLKGFDLTLPRNKLIVFTGLSALLHMPSSKTMFCF